MDTSILLEYGWVLLVLIALEGILAADNAVVMAVMVKHLPEDQQKKALFYGLFGAFVFRVTALFLITFLVNIWQVQALGAAYLLYISISHLIKKGKDEEDTAHMPEKKKSGFWMTVLKVEIADIAFAIDSMLAAVALAITLPEIGGDFVGGINSGQFTVMLLGGLIGLVIMRFAATWFVKVLQKYPQLETAAFLIVGWVGVKLVFYTLGHKNLEIISYDFVHGPIFKVIFWVVLLGIGLGGYISSRRQNEASTN